MLAAWIHSTVKHTSVRQTFAPVAVFAFYAAVWTSSISYVRQPLTFRMQFDTSCPGPHRRHLANGYSLQIGRYNFYVGKRRSGVVWRPDNVTSVYFARIRFANEVHPRIYDEYLIKWTVTQYVKRFKTYEKWGKLCLCIITNWFMYICKFCNKTFGCVYMHF